MITLLLAPTALAGTWNLDPAHTTVGFEVTHMMVSSVEGTFPGVTGTLDYEPSDPDATSVRVTVDMASVDTGNDDRDGHLRSPDFLDVEAHPQMTFRSTGFQAKRKGRFALTGDLTIKGVTKPVTLVGTGLDQVVTDPWGNERVGATASTTINRKDFGVNWNQTLDAGGVLVGEELTLSIGVEFTKAK